MNDWETAIDHLRGCGWKVRWFSYVSRTGQSVWRASGIKAEQPVVTIESDFLPEAILGLARACDAREALSKRE